MGIGTLELSLICPTRGRVDGLPLMCGNLMETAGSLASFEVLWVYDDYDVATGVALERCRAMFPALRMRVFHKERDLNLSDGYFNWACHRANPRGRFIWAMGNDIRFRSRGWDQAMVGAMEEYLVDKPDRIALGFARDAHQTDKGDMGFEWGCFPLLTREAVAALGWFFPKEFITWEADVVMAKMFWELGRLVPVPEVVVDQISYHAYPEVTRDGVAMSMRERHNIPGQASLRNWYKREQMPRDIKRLREVMARGRVETEEPVQ